MLRIEAERRRLGLSKAALARRAVMNPSTVGQILNQRLKPYDRELARMADALDWPAARAAELLEEVGG